MKAWALFMVYVVWPCCYYPSVLFAKLDLMFFRWAHYVDQRWNCEFWNADE